MRPLQKLPQQPLKSRTGERLVLRNTDEGYPDQAFPNDSPGMGTWFSNIASVDTETFLKDINISIERPGDEHKIWQWPAVVLTPEEYKLRVGGMSITMLRNQLEEFWGQGGVPGEGSYQDMWVPAWAPDRYLNPYDLLWFPRSLSAPIPPSLNQRIFSRWASRECTQWLNYFIGRNHTFGAVHAWFSAFLGVTRENLIVLANLFADTAQYQNPWSIDAISRGFRMSFNKCIESYDQAMDGLPSPPLNVKITTNTQGKFIDDSIENMVPRRIWDICANTVIPTTWFTGPPYSFRKGRVALGVRPISHAWAAGDDRHIIMTEANQQLWPITLPKGVLVEDVRGELIRLGVRYAWLDILCLRQRDKLAKDMSIPIVKRLEERRLEEWETDVPTIGAIYINSNKFGLYRGGRIVIFLSGLGRPFRDEGWDSKRQWLNRAWTLQETPILSLCLFAGLPGGVNYWWDESGQSVNQWPWNCKVHNHQLLHAAMTDAAAMQPVTQLTGEVTNLDYLFRAIRDRDATNTLDKLFALSIPFHKREHGMDGRGKKITLPVYDPQMPIPVAWAHIIASFASTNIGKGFAPYDELKPVTQDTTTQLLCLFPHPSRDHWFPSWDQVGRYPDVSITEKHLAPDAESVDCSLRITYGRIYRGCSLQLIQSPTSMTKAVYRSTMGSNYAQLVATVPGVEPDINSASRYVLVDISPDHSLRSMIPRSHCEGNTAGHEHLPIWRESVIIVCEEVDIVAQPSSTVMRYRLRRVTTLMWDCRLPTRPRPPGLGRWLPFTPSLLHMRSVVCSAGGHRAVLLLRASDERDPDVFCDPAAAAGVLSRAGWHQEWDKQWPAYEVYLV